MRELAADYFADSFSPDPTIAPLVLQAIEQYGPSNAFSSYFFVSQLAHTSQTVSWIVRELQKIGEPDDATEAYCMGLTYALSTVAPHLLQPHCGEIEALRQIAPGIHGMTLGRVKYQRLSADELWRRFEGFVAEPYDEYPEFPETETLKDIAALLPNDPRMVTWVLQTLARNADDPEYSVWREGVAVQLAGELKLPGAVPRLVALLHDDEFSLNQDTITSLVRIGTDEVTAQLDRRYLMAENGFCWRAAAVLECLHTDRSIGTMRFWYKNEADSAVRHRILRALLCNFVPAAVEPARQALSSDSATEELTSLRMELVAFCTLTETSFPELETWREEARRDFLDEMSESGQRDEGDDEGWEEEDWQDQEDGDEEDAAAAPADRDLGWDDSLLPGLGSDVEEPAGWSEPIVNTGPRTGRNDPCPCGSGKKYKKCCLRK